VRGYIELLGSNLEKGVNGDFKVRGPFVLDETARLVKALSVVIQVGRRHEGHRGNRAPRPERTQGAGSARELTS
jgi:hypothetical protein